MHAGSSKSAESNSSSWRACLYKYFVHRGLIGLNYIGQKRALCYAIFPQSYRNKSSPCERAFVNEFMIAVHLFHANVSARVSLGD